MIQADAADPGERLIRLGACQGAASALKCLHDHAYLDAAEHRVPQRVCQRLVRAGRVGGQQQFTLGLTDNLR